MSHHSEDAWPAQPANRRREERHGVVLPGVVCQTYSCKLPAEIRDISTVGCRVALPHDLTVGKAIQVKIASLEALFGMVRWSDGQEAGVEFNQPLHPYVLDYLLRLPSPHNRVRARIRQEMSCDYATGTLHSKVMHKLSDVPG